MSRSDPGVLRALCTPPPIGPVVTGALGHYLGRTLVGGAEITTYATQPFPLARPARGWAEGELTCDRCGKTMSCKVFSAVVARRRRVAFLVAGLLLSVVSLTGFVVSTSHVGVALVAVSCLLFVPIAALFGRWWAEDGVVGAGPFGGFPGPHRMRPPRTS